MTHYILCTFWLKLVIDIRKSTQVEVKFYQMINNIQCSKPKFRLCSTVSIIGHTYNEWSLIAKFTFTNWLLFFVIVTALIVDDENYYANLRSDNVHNEIKSFDDIGKNTASVRILMISNSRAARYLQGVADIEQRYFE